jgi:hypothetical protein
MDDAYISEKEDLFSELLRDSLSASRLLPAGKF